MSYLFDQEFKDMLREEIKQKKESLQLLAIMFCTAFSASFLTVLFLWDALRYDGARLSIALFCIFNFLFACFTIYDTLIDPFNKATERWKRDKRLREGRALLDTSPLFNTSVKSEDRSETTRSPMPILKLSRSPRGGRSRLGETRETVSSVCAQVTIGNLSSSPRRLRPHTLDIQPSSSIKTGPVQPAVNPLVVPVEVHQVEDSSLAEI